MRTNKVEQKDPFEQLIEFKSSIDKNNDFQGKAYMSMCDVWLGYTTQERAQCYRLWDEYYELCKTSEAYGMYDEMRRLLASNNIKELLSNMPRVKRLRQTMTKLPVPNCIDPYLLRYNQTCNTYMKLMKACSYARQQEETA